MLAWRYCLWRGSVPRCRECGEPAQLVLDGETPVCFLHGDGAGPVVARGVRPSDCLEDWGDAR